MLHILLQLLGVTRSQGAREQPGIQNVFLPPWECSVHCGLAGLSVHFLLIVILTCTHLTSHISYPIQLTSTVVPTPANSPTVVLCCPLLIWVCNFSIHWSPTVVYYNVTPGQRDWTLKVSTVDWFNGMYSRMRGWDPSQPFSGDFDVPRMDSGMLANFVSSWDFTLQTLRLLTRWLSNHNHCQ